MNSPLRSRLVFLSVSIVLMLLLLSGSFRSVAPAGAAEPGKDKTNEDTGSIYKYLSIFTETLNLVRTAGVEETPTDTLMANAMDGVTDALDPFSIYVPANQYSAYTRALAIGPGRSGLRLVKERGFALVIGAGEGSPAAKAGLEVGDLVSKVDGRPTRVMPLWELVEIFAGAPGAKVAVEVIHKAEPKNVTLTLADWQAPAPHVDELRGGVAMLRIAELGPQTAAATETVLRGLQERKKLMLDLRDTSGAEPAVGYAVAELFARGDLGALVRRGDTVSTFTSTREPAWKGELVVLVDRGTVGAGEVLATVLRQAVGAKLVGADETFGYAGRSAVIDVRDGGKLQLTDAFYSGPDKKPLREGLTPDLEVDERIRTFSEKDVPVPELVRERALRLLLGEDSLPAKKAA